MTIAAALTRIDSALRDGNISREEWAQIQAELRDTVPTASEPARRLLAAFEAARCSFEIMGEVAAYLRSAGYALEESRDLVGVSMRTPDVRAERVRREARGEDDPDFARLASEVGVPVASREVVGVLDDGFDLSSPLLITRGVEGRDISHSDDEVTVMDHGTATASICATGDPRLRVMPLEALEGGVDTIARGIDFAAAHGVRVMNMSFRTASADDVRLTLEAMRRHPEVTFVLAAGNDSGVLGVDPGLTSDIMLAANALPNLIVIAAADRSGAPAGYTNRGEAFAHVAARGSEMLVPFRDGAREVHDGTSLAAPRVSSLVARLRLLAPDLRPEQLRQILLVSSNRDDRWSGLVGCGGTVNELRAQNLAAAIRLLQAGATDAQVIERLALPPATSAALLRDARLVLRM